MIYAFDFDGTLVDTMPALTSAGTLVIAKHYGVSGADAYAMYVSTVGVSFRDQLEELFPGDPKNLDAESDFWDYHVEAYVRLERAFPGVYELLETLLAEGHVCWVVTSSPSALVDAPARRVLPFGVRVLGREKGTKVEQLRRCQAHVFFGDTKRDAEFAQEAGCDFVGVSANPYTFVLTGAVAGRTLPEAMKMYSSRWIQPVLENGWV